MFGESNSMTALTCFKAYDIRGKLGEELTETIAYHIGRSYAQYLEARKVVVGGDVRATSNALKLALARGMMDAGCDVIDLGMTGTEEVYFASFHLDVDGGIEVTASHNPIDYNGMKLVKRGAQPISGDTGLKDIRKLVETQAFEYGTRRGGYIQLDLRETYLEHVLGHIDLNKLKPLKLVVNAGNGSAGPVIDVLENMLQQRRIPIEFIKVHHQPDPTFPNGIPNPLLPENRRATSEAVIQHQADMGIAWDGDFDRCFLFDEKGEFIEGYYIVGLLAEAFLKKNPGEKIIHDPRMTWNTIDICQQYGGEAIQSKTGHAFIKERMRKENAVYGGEMSAHHYFRDFGYCDSGMIPWLLVAELICVENRQLSQLVDTRVQAFPCSGEINFNVADVNASIEKVRAHFAFLHPQVDETDGLSLEFDAWRLNLRGSNTEPLLRLNIEAKADAYTVKSNLQTLENLLEVGPC